MVKYQTIHCLSLPIYLKIYFRLILIYYGAMVVIKRILHFYIISMWVLPWKKKHQDKTPENAHGNVSIESRCFVTGDDDKRVLGLDRSHRAQHVSRLVAGFESSVGFSYGARSHLFVPLPCARPLIHENPVPEGGYYGAGCQNAVK